MSSGFVVWFTGLSGAGKSTLAAMLAAELRGRGVHVELLDGDEVRTHLSKGLGFSREDRATNIRRIGFVAKLIARSGGCAMTAAISPYRSIRDEQRAQIPHFVEVYCACSIPALTERDPKGLYKKALAGEIKNFTGIDDPYEEPLRPEVTVYTDKETKEESLSKIVHKLEALGYIPTRDGLVSRQKGRGLCLPHGGELVRRLVLDKLRGTQTIRLDARARAALDCFATGAYSPLKGFLGSKDYLRVVRERRLENGLVWPMAVTLPLSSKDAASLQVGTLVSLAGEDGAIVGALEVTDIFAPKGTVYLGGEVSVFERAPVPEWGRRLDPAETRRIFEERGYRRVVGFVAREPADRRAEYITKTALEPSDALLIQVSVEAGREVYESWERMIERAYPRERVVLSLDEGPSLGGGAREVLLRAMVLQNHGASHVIVTHEDAKGVEEILDELGAGEIGVELLFYSEVAYCEATGSMASEKTAPVKG